MPWSPRQQRAIAAHLHDEGKSEEEISAFFRKHGKKKKLHAVAKKGDPPKGKLGSGSRFAAIEAKAAASGARNPAAVAAAAGMKAHGKAQMQRWARASRKH
jgi:hypothetical protein